MRITYSDAIANNKNESIKNLASNFKWYSCAGNYDEIIKLYRSGRSINICDFKQSDTVIIDCDELTDKQVEQLKDKRFIDMIKSNLHAKRVDVFDSASQKYNKKKIFLNFDYKRNIVDNIDVNYKNIRERFQLYTQMKTDSAMDSFTQITFGRKEIDYTPNNTNHTLTSQPKKNNNFEKRSFIPVNQREINAEHGSKVYKMPRLEWNCDHFDHKTHKFVTNTIKQGNRHRQIGKLIKVVTFNAIRENIYFDKNYTYKDVISKIKGIITRQFINASKFKEEELLNIEKQCYKEFINGNSKNLEDYYKECCKNCIEKERYKYTPRKYSITNRYRLYKYKFDKCNNREEIISLAQKIANDDPEIIEKLINKHCKTSKIRKSKHTYKEYINTCKKINDFYLVDRNMIKNTSFRKYCKNNNIKITSSKNTINKVSKLTQTATQFDSSFKNVKEKAPNIILNTRLNIKNSVCFDIFDDSYSKIVQKCYSAYNKTRKKE